MNPSKIELTPEFEFTQELLSERFSQEILNGNFQGALSSIDLAEKYGFKLRVLASVTRGFFPIGEYEKMQSAIVLIPSRDLKYFEQQHFITLHSKLARQQIEAKIAERSSAR